MPKRVGKHLPLQYFLHVVNIIMILKDQALLFPTRYLETSLELAWTRKTQLIKHKVKLAHSETRLET